MVEHLLTKRRPRRAASELSSSSAAPSAPARGCCRPAACPPAAPASSTACTGRRRRGRFGFGSGSGFGFTGPSSSASRFRPSPPSLTVILTVPPFLSLPNSTSSASGFLMCSWMTRPSGRAPMRLVVALLGQPVVASSERSKVTPRSASCASSCRTNFCTTWRTTSGGRSPNGTIASSRLRNSGVNRRLIASSSSPVALRLAEADRRPCARSAAPALVVMIRMTLRKSTCLPLWSVSLPWSITCSRMLNRSGCAFSISSSSSTQCGCWSTPSVSRPPWSKPT